MKSYLDFVYFSDPPAFLEEYLIVSDGMGYIYNPSFIIDRNYFNNNLIMFVLKGTLVVEQFGITHKIVEKQGILMELTQTHKYYFMKSTDTHIIWLHFRGNPVQQLLEKLSSNKKLPMVFDAPWLENEIYNIFDLAKEGGSTNDFIISSKVYSILIEITKDELIEVQKKSYYSFKNKMDNFISNNLGSKLSLEEIANHFNMSKYHFCRRFKEHLNATPFEYIKIKKIEIAKKMLICTNDSISDISNYLGFYDQGYFSNIFKSVEGCSPNKYRNQS